MESFEAFFTKVGIIGNGLIGSAVFNDQYMFSQQGVDSSGIPSSNYKEFNKDNPTEGNFTPNLLFDLSDGSGYLAQKGIS
jgi:hypothetical protein